MVNAAASTPLIESPDVSLDDKIAFLSVPENWPGHPRRVTLVHTHHACLFMTEQSSLPGRNRAFIVLLAVAAACAPSGNLLDDYEEVPATTLFEAPSPTAVAAVDREAVAQGKYLVELLGCGAFCTRFPRA